MHEWENIIKDYSGIFAEENNRLALWNEVRGDIRERVASSHESPMAMTLIRDALVNEHAAQLVDDSDEQGYELVEHGLDSWDVTLDGQVVDDAIIYYSDDYFIARLGDEQGEFLNLQDAWDWLQENLRIADDAALEQEQAAVYQGTPDQQAQEVVAALSQNHQAAVQDFGHYDDDEHVAFRRTQIRGEVADDKWSWRPLGPWPEPLPGSDSSIQYYISEYHPYDHIWYKGDLLVHGLMMRESTPQQTKDGVKRELLSGVVEDQPVSKQAGFEDAHIIDNDPSAMQLVGQMVKALLSAGITMSPLIVSAWINDYSRGHSNSNIGAWWDGLWDYMVTRANAEGYNRGGNQAKNVVRNMRIGSENNEQIYHDNGLTVTDNGVLSGIAFRDPKLGYCYGIFSADGYEVGGKVGSMDEAQERIASCMEAVAQE